MRSSFWTCMTRFMYGQAPEWRTIYGNSRPSASRFVVMTFWKILVSCCYYLRCVDSDYFGFVDILFTLTLTFCFQRYIETDPAGRLDETISVWFLTQNNEPDSFTKFFPYWTINGISVYGQLYFILLFINKDTILIFWSLPFHGSCIPFMSYFMIVVIFSIFFLNLNNFVSNLKWPIPFLYTLLSIFQICGEVSVL